MTENVNCSKMQQKAPNFINLTRSVKGLVSMRPINWNYLDSIDEETQGLKKKNRHSQAIHEKEGQEVDVKIPRSV